ncbi:MAG: hypothetical protein HYX23_00995 [Candidatus Zambryskibacteria bacterium]|nr:hypothetical protein [Candidatus Zambryskibacteria bacterium]
MERNENVLVVFGEDLPSKWLESPHKVNVIVAKESLRHDIEAMGLKFVSIEPLIEAGSVHEASVFAEELSRLTLPDGSRLAESFTYKGYELWWMYYNSLFLYFCLPYTQYKKLLEYLKDFKSVYLYRPAYKNLFHSYLVAYGCEANILRDPRLKSPPFLPFGIFLQIIITLLCLPVLMVRRHGLMVFVGDKFAKSKDYDFRMKFIYEELRQRKIPFVEFIRSLESWKAVLQHVFVRKRPVIYSEGVAFVGKFFGIFSDKPRFSIPEQDPESKFKFIIATHYLRSGYDDIWAIRIMKWILWAIGVKAAFITAATERNFHAFLGCKLNAIPTVGILHGVASRHYTVYDFLPSFNGTGTMSVDKYGLWSEWWKKYYLENSKVYLPEQLYVSGLMRPLERKERSDLNTDSKGPTLKSGPIKVLFVAGQLTAPMEAIPYLLALVEAKGLSVHITFRPYRDDFEKWLRGHYPEILEKIGEGNILRGDIHDAIAQCDVIVGAYSTAVLEGLLQFRVPVFFRTKKWGDYYSLKEYDEEHSFFAENPAELIAKIKNARTVSKEDLKKLQEKYFGDPYKNGSKWVVDQLEGALLKGCITK